MENVFKVYNIYLYWLINTNLSVDCRILELLIWLENTRLVNVDDWTVQKVCYMNLCCKITSNCKIPIMQVDWRFKLIQYSLNSEFCLRKLNEKSRKTGFYIHLFLHYKNSNSSNMSPGLEISIGHRAMTDSNKCLIDLKLLQLDVVSERKIENNVSVQA